MLSGHLSFNVFTLESQGGVWVVASYLYLAQGRITLTPSTRPRPVTAATSAQHHIFTTHMTATGNADNIIIIKGGHTPGGAWPHPPSYATPEG